MTECTWHDDEMTLPDQEVHRKLQREYMENQRQLALFSQHLFALYNHLSMMLWYRTAAHTGLAHPCLLPLLCSPGTLVVNRTKNWSMPDMHFMAL